MLRDKNRQKEKGAEEAMWALGDKIKEELRTKYKMCFDNLYNFCLKHFPFEEEFSKIHVFI